MEEISGFLDELGPFQVLHIHRPAVGLRALAGRRVREALLTRRWR